MEGIAPHLATIDTGRILILASYTQSLSGLLTTFLDL